MLRLFERLLKVNVASVMTFSSDVRAHPCGQTDPERWMRGNSRALW
jgi:hypothetical protein